MRVQRSVVGGGVAVLMSAALAACGSSSSGGGGQATAASGGDGNGGKTVTVKMALQQGAASNLPPIITQREGFLKDKGIDIQFVPMQGGAVLSSVVSGSVDFIMQAPQVVGTAIQQSQDLQFFCGDVERNWTTIVALKGSGLPSTERGATWQQVVRALKGKKLGVTALGATQEQFAKGLFKAAGLAPDDVTLVPIGVGPPQLAALKAKQVDAMFGSPFVPQQLAADGSGETLYDFSGSGPFQGQVLAGFAATPKWLDAHADVAQAMCAAFGRAMKFATDPANRQEMDGILESDFGITDPKLADEVLAPDGPLKLFNPTMPCDGLMSAVKFLEQAGTFKSEPALTCDNMIWHPKA